MYSPTVIYVENTESDIRDIPFPSMKICSTNQIRKLVWERHENTNTSYWWVSTELGILVDSYNIVKLSAQYCIVCYNIIYIFPDEMFITFSF